jgi:adenylate cyclase class 2
MVNIETEYKFAVKNIKNLKEKLDSLASILYDRQYQSNVMFDNKSELMQKTNGRIRVRTLGDTGGKVLTYKKPVSSKDGAKKEIEYEITFSDKASNIEKILSAIEFTPTTSYERYRTEWKINNCLVVIDEYPFANFIEIEGRLDAIKKLARELGFDEKNALTDPADTLFQTWRAKQGLNFKPHMRFDDYDK